MRKDQRRKFLIASSALLATPLAVLSQPAQQVRRIGFLSPWPSTSSIGQFSRQTAVEALRRAGYEEGRNLAIAWRFAEEHPERLPKLAEELVRLDVELIIAVTNYPTLAAKAATRTIPVVMHGSFLPKENRLIESLARPGGNVTGTASWDRMQTVDKSFQLLKEAVPHAKRVAALIDPNIPLNYQYDYFHGEEQVRNLAAIGLSLQRFQLTRPEDLAEVLKRVVASRADALVVYVTNPVVLIRLREVVAFTIENKLVSIGDGPVYVNAGGLLYYGPDQSALWDRTASYVDRILRGAKAADLPVEQSAKWELVLNDKTARAIGFKPPPSFLLRVDRVID